MRKSTGKPKRKSIRKVIGSILEWGGAIMIAVALTIACFNFQEEQAASSSVMSLGEAVRQKISQTKEILSGGDYTVPAVDSVPDYILNPDMEMPVVEVEGRLVIGEIIVPSQEIQLPVLSEWSEIAAKQAPCRYQGSVYTDDMVIAGHNYRSHFKPLAQVEIGDAVIFTDMDGNEFHYVVCAIETIDGTDIAGMLAGDWDLTLFTCTYGGTQRTTIRCQRSPSDD